MCNEKTKRPSCTVFVFPSHYLKAGVCAHVCKLLPNKVVTSSRSFQNQRRWPKSLWETSRPPSCLPWVRSQHPCCSGCSDTTSQISAKRQGRGVCHMFPQAPANRGSGKRPAGPHAWRHSRRPGDSPACSHSAPPYRDGNCRSDWRPTGWVSPTHASPPGAPLEKTQSTWPSGPALLRASSCPRVTLSRWPLCKHHRHGLSPHNLSHCHL